MIEMRYGVAFSGPASFSMMLAGALVGLLGAFREHRAALLIDDLDVEALFGLLDHDVL